MTTASRGERPQLKASHRRAEEVRLIRRVESLEVHRRGLERAVEAFGEGEMDPGTWHRAFASADPDDVVARNALTGCYSALVNGYVELLKTGSYLAGLTPHKKDHTRNAIDCVRDDGGITKDQATCLHELFANAPGLIESAIRWLERHRVRA
jgi:hypothetical protein